MGLLKNHIFSYSSLYKSGEYPHDTVKFWLALTSKALPQQNWVWMKRAPLNWTNWDTPVPPAIKYEILDPHYHENYNTCGVGWAQKSSQTSGWLNTKCTADTTYGEVITICQRKPSETLI